MPRGLPRLVPNETVGRCRAQAIGGPGEAVAAVTAPLQRGRGLF